MRELVFHSLCMRKVQTAAIVVSVAISMTVMFALVLVYAGVDKGIRANEQRMGAQCIAIPKDAADHITDAGLLFTGAPASIFMDKEVASDIAATSGVAAVTTQFYCQTLDQSCCTTTEPTRLIGFDPESDWMVRALSSVELPDSLGPNVVIVGADVEWAGGDLITILGSRYQVLTQLAASGSELDSSILMDIDTARAIARAHSEFADLWEQYGDPDTLVSAVLFDVDEGADSATVVNRVKELSGVSVLQRSKVVSAAQQGLGSIFSVMTFLGIMMLAATILQLLGRFYSCVWDRKSELSLYRAVGANEHDLARLIGGEAVCLVGAGVVLGLVLGSGCYVWLLAVMRGSAAFPFIALSAAQVVLVILALIILFVLVTAVALYVPLRQVRKLDPSIAMQQGDID